MFKRTTYQNGCLSREERKRGPKVWIFRWRETAPDGHRVNRKVVVGSVKEYKTEAAAKKAVDALVSTSTKKLLNRCVQIERSKSWLSTTGKRN